MSLATAIPTTSPAPKLTRARKTRTDKSPARHGSTKAKASFYLSVDAIRRLTVHAAFTDTDRSAVIEQLVQAHCRDWVVSYRGSRTPSDIEEDRQEETAG